MNRTELRHRVLTLIESGPGVEYRCKNIRAGRWKYELANGSVLGGPEARAVGEFSAVGLIYERLLAGFYWPRPVELTLTGKSLLAEWDEKYGPVTP